MFLSTGIVKGQYGGGSGQSEDPYLIFTPKHMAQIGRNPQDWDKHFKLMSDVDMHDYTDPEGEFSFVTIGYMQWQPYECRPFKGVFNGNRKRILNLTIIRTGCDFVGLFGYVHGNEARIKDVTLVNPQIKAWTSTYVGAVAGKLRCGSITGCKVDGGSVMGSCNVGGLVGYNSQGTIQNCHIQTDVSGHIDIGGIVGYHCGAMLSGCSFSGNMKGVEDVGGVVGESDGFITNCYATGHIVGKRDKVAGLVGTLRGRVESCSVDCLVNGRLEVGGLIGRNNGQILNSYARGAVNGVNHIGGLTGLLYGKGLASKCYAICDITSTEAQWGEFIGWGDLESVVASFWVEGRMSEEDMMLQSTYTSAGWDFVGESANGSSELWDICEGTDFPRLSWESVAVGDWICPEGVDLYDMAILFEHWLLRSPNVDISGNGTDGFVNFKDLAAIGAAWKTSPGLPEWNASCDIWPQGGDDVVDFGDLAVLAENWLKGGSNPSDIEKESGNGIVDFMDWTIFAECWQSTPSSANWDARFDIWPDGGDGKVDMEDMAEFSERWLGAGTGFGDIAPQGTGDGIVNLLDFALAARNSR